MLLTFTTDISLITLLLCISFYLHRSNYKLHAENFILFCLTVTWLKDGKPIDESSSRYLFSSDGNKSFEVRIKSCTAGDIGQYAARSIGKKGETNIAFALNVTSPNDQ